MRYGLRNREEQDVLGPSVRLRVGRVEADVRSGGIVGRLPGAQLRVLDPRVSEAHALVSLRGSGFRLLALRGALWVHGEREDALDLLPGLTVELVEGLVLEVVGVPRLPETVVAARVDRQPPQLLWTDLYSVQPRGESEVVPGYVADAEGWVFTSGQRWWFQAADGSMSQFDTGRSWALRGGHVLEAVAVPLGHVEATTTSPSPGSALDVVGRWDTAHLRRPGRTPVALSGLQARLVTELGTMRSPVDWRVVAGALWRGDPRRRSYDRLLKRLRHTLRRHGIRTDLVRATGTGMVELYLHAGDRFVEQQV